MNEQQQMVLEFHRVTSTYAQAQPGLPPLDVQQLRARLIAEEVREFRQAVRAQDLVKIADALGDLLYAAYGAALAYGLDMEPIFEEIHRSNMSKRGGPKRSDGKQLKPSGYEPPRLEAMLEHMNGIMPNGL